MSLTRFAFALPVLLAAMPALAQNYYYAPPPQRQQPVYEDDPRYAPPQPARPVDPRYADNGYAQAPAYRRRDPYYGNQAYAREPGYAEPRGYPQPYGYAQPYPRRAPVYQRDDASQGRYDDAPAEQRQDYAGEGYARDERGQAYANAPIPPRRAPEPAYADQPAPAPAAAPAPEQHVAVDRLDQMMWQAASQADSLSAYSTYLNRYPDSGHARDAQASIERLRRMPPQAARPIEPAPIVESAAAPAAAPLPAAPAPAAAVATAPAPVMPGGKPLPIVAVATAPVPVAPAETVDPTPALAAAAPVAAKAATIVATAATGTAEAAPAAMVAATATPAAAPAAVEALAANAAVAGPAAQPVLVASASSRPAPVQPTAGVAPTELPPAVCRPAFGGDVPYDQASEAEIAAYLRANQLNSIGGYEAYLQAYPRGVFAPEVAELVAARQGRIAAIARVAVAGPATARPQAQLSPGDRDYPSAALRDGQQGQATAIWEVAEDGCVEQCRIDRSSGSAALDAATCRMITSRGRYDPALNAEGKPIRSLDSATFAWNLPVH